MDFSAVLSGVWKGPCISRLQARWGINAELLSSQSAPKPPLLASMHLISVRFQKAGLVFAGEQGTKGPHVLELLFYQPHSVPLAVASKL